jgi:hypothetical protein
MISEEQIVKFPADKQQQIRAAIENFERNGYERRFLALRDNGSVYYDALEEEAAIDLEELGKL